MDRRTFLSWVGVGALASSLPIVIIACSNSEDNSTGLEQNATEVKTNNFQMIGLASELDTKGVLVNEDIADKPVMVFRHPETEKLIALNPECTHQKCNVELNIKTNLLVCPCHDSHFALDGTAVKKPATKPLEVYKVKQEEHLIFVKVV
ncbi:MAG: Rieske 2Fe-2S domain-containing protein [Xenococcaceae cyanobacterium MO_188.B29]|nr:Rieske 2Fe-2S domain-containing protein [Xenococcaceae cyanobacterium MO_188.B29]